MSRAKIVVAAVLTLALAAALAVPAVAQQKVVVFSAGPTGGSWTPMAAATADIVKKRFAEVDVQVEPGAALINMEKIRADKADLGMSMTTVLSDAREGKNVWKGKQTDKPLFVANFYPNVWQLVVPADSDVRTVADLKGKPVALPPRGNTSLSDGWELILRLHGLKLDDLGAKSFGSLSENVELIKNRQAVAAGWYTTVPASFVLDLGSARKVRLLSLTDATIEEMRKYNPGFARHVIPKAAYAAQGVETDVVTVQAATILIASSRTPADVIYKVTKAIVEGRDAYVNVTAAMKGVTAEGIALNYGMPYHPGAERYYREAGLAK